MGLGWLSGLGLNFLLASASCTRAHIASLDSCCRPTAGKCCSPAGLSTLVYAYVVDSAPASPYAYSSRFSDERKRDDGDPLNGIIIVVAVLHGLVTVLETRTSAAERSQRSKTGQEPIGCNNTAHFNTVR
jgi:hypothetical protein